MPIERTRSFEMRVASPWMMAGLLLVAHSGFSPRGDRTIGHRRLSPPSGVLAQQSILFSQMFRRGERFVLEQSDSLPIVRMSGVDVAPDGRIAIGDGSEGIVRIHASTGRLLKIIGRRGDGPGEFQDPRFPKFDRTGRLHVADPQLRRISVFDTDGRLLKSVSVQSVASIAGFGLLSAGEYLLADRGGVELVHRVDSVGKPVASYFRRAANWWPVEGTPQPSLRVFLQYFVESRNDSAFVGVALSDSVWSIDIKSGRQAGANVRFPGYLVPYVDPKEPFSRAKVAQIARAFHLVSFFGVARDAVVVAYTRGVLHQGDPTTLMIQRAGRWYEVQSAPPVIHVSEGRLLAMEMPLNGDSVAVAWYRYR